MTESSAALTCPNCAQRFAWSPQLAGRKVKCPACQQVMRLPQQPGGAVEPIGGLLKDADQTYQLAESDGDSGKGSSRSKEDFPSRGAVPTRCPNCNSKLKVGAVICVNCGYHVEKGARLDTQVGEAAGSDSDAKAAKSNVAGLGAYASLIGAAGLDHSALAEDSERQQWRKDVMIPVVLIIMALAGILLHCLVLETLVNNMMLDKQYQTDLKIAQAWGTPPPNPPSHSISVTRVATDLAAVSIRLIIQVPLLLLAIFITARLFGSSFGTLGPAMLKLMALALFTDMVNDVVYAILNLVTGGWAGIGLLISLSINFSVFVLLCIWLFEMEYLEALVMWLLVFLGPTLVMFFLFTLLVSIFA